MPHKKILVIDPGHGGTDPGAIGANGIREKDVVLRVAREIVRWNHALLDGKYEIYLTRYRDTLVSLSDRPKLARALEADVFVSLHCNHSDNALAKGMEVYVHKPNKIHSKQSLALGVSILAEVVHHLGIIDRNIKTANFQVLRETFRVCPAVLVELGFLSNGDESSYLLADRNVKAQALAILMATVEFLYMGLY